MSDVVKKIRTTSGDLPVDYTALANLPSGGGTNQPVYLANGVPTPIGYTIKKSVPADAKFTDTTYTLASFGIEATAAELNTLKGATTFIQNQLNAKAASSHNHAAGEITSGTLPIARGGTGATTVDGILTNLGNIGKIYTGTPAATSVPAYNTELANIASVTLPAGTYIVVGNAQWPGDHPSAMYMHRLAKDDNNVYGTTRGFMIGGGGAQTVAIISLTTQTIIKYQVYNGHSAALTPEAISLTAVKIK